VLEDAPADEEFGDQGDEHAPAAAVEAGEDVDREDAAHELGPGAGI
jgi:hypothetical protein